MSDTLRLFCLVRDDDPRHVFAVDIAGDKTVYHLKEMIKEKQQQIFRDIDAATLKILKVDVDLSKDKGASLKDAKFRDGVDGVKELWAMDLLSNEFPGPDGPKIGHLHIIVERPAGASRKHSVFHTIEEDDHAVKKPRTELVLDWLVELHEKLWGREDLLDKIICTVTLNKTDLIKLETKLEELNPSRGFGTYTPKNVQDVKSAFLKSKNELSAETPSGPEATSSSAVDHVIDVGDPVHPPESKDDSSDLSELSELSDDATSLSTSPNLPEPKSVAAIVADILKAAPLIFPCKIRYMDLTGLELKYRLRVPTLMLIRSEWDAMMQTLEKCHKGVDGSIVVTGQPGIGKTCFLYYCLVLRLVASKHTVFQDKDGSVFFITDQVRKEGPIKGDDILTLVDADGNKCIPREAVLANTNYRILLTSSPRRSEDRKWMTQHCPYMGQVLVMEPFSWDEVIQIALFIFDFDIPFERIRAAAQVFGNLPCQCFRAASSRSFFREAKAKIIKAISDIQDIENAINNVNGNRPVPHPAFEIYPDAESREYWLCLVRPVSQWAFDQLITEMEKRNQDGGYKFYKQVQAIPAAASFCGGIWERHVHQYFRSITTPTTFRMCSLDNRTDTIDIQFSSATLHEEFGAAQVFEGRLASSIREGKSCYLKPKVKNYPTLDSLLYEHDARRTGFQPLIGFQMTEALTHPLSVKGLAAIQTSLKPRVPALNALRSSSLQKWIIAFVVPAPMEQSFTKQGFTDPDGKLHWVTKTAQYVLGLNVDAVFKRIPESPRQ